MNFLIQIGNTQYLNTEFNTLLEIGNGKGEHLR